MTNIFILYFELFFFEKKFREISLYKKSFKSFKVRRAKKFSLKLSHLSRPQFFPILSYEFNYNIFIFSYVSSLHNGTFSFEINSICGAIKLQKAKLKNLPSVSCDIFLGTSNEILKLICNNFFHYIFTLIILDIRSIVLTPKAH